ncbi:MAG: EamA family transporter [Chloroflexota bacterium]|nr:EamA family transporter [Chloroflexota bacterium]
MGLAILSSALYHVFQKMTPSDVDPMLSLLVTYATAIVICLVLLAVHPPKTGIIESLRRLNWASFALALAIIGLEIGFLLAYRSGWNISLGAIVANVAVTIVLIPVGFLFFKERVSLVNFIGIFVCIVGLVMVNQQ